jgi:antitoxin component of MazEF toxin-antitoxin module
VSIPEVDFLKEGDEVEVSVTVNKEIIIRKASIK